MEENKNNLFFALDIGTHSVIGVVAKKQDRKVEVLAIEEETYDSRAMIDGQIQDIDVVARAATNVKERISKDLNTTFTSVSVAAAGRTLKTVTASYKVEYDEAMVMTFEEVSHINSAAVGKAEEIFAQELREKGEDDTAFYLAGYSIVEYTLDGYPMQKLLDHQGKVIEAKAIATFLPREVVESLYTAMRKAGLEIATLTLEPIAAMNAVIPEDLRLLNLALVDIGAGTSDIAISKDGSIVGYTMATIAGDEITEAIMKKLLIDFKTAESMKMKLSDISEKEIFSMEYNDILGLPHTVTYEEIMDIIEDSADELAVKIAEGITEVNGGSPSAVFMVGGGSRLPNLCSKMATLLEMDENRVAVGGNSFEKTAYSDKYSINNPIYATPLGIVLSAAFDLNNEGFNITLNNKRCRLFRSDNIKVFDVLLMNGYHHRDLISRTGSSMAVYINGIRKVFYPEIPKPAIITINGQEATATTVVKAGDNIEFQPAERAGAPEVYFSELLDDFRVFSVIYNDDQYYGGNFITTEECIITSKEEAEKTKLKNFDRIRIADIKTVGDLRNFYHIPEKIVDVTTGMGDEAVLYDNMKLVSEDEYKNKPKQEPVSINREEMLKTIAKPGPSVLESYERTYEKNFETHDRKNSESSGDSLKATGGSALNNGGNASTGNAAAAGNSAAAGNAAGSSSSAGSNKAPGLNNTQAAKPVASSVKDKSEMMTVYINGKSIELPSRSKNNPYLLLDMLQYTGYDFEKPQRGVNMHINGADSGFTSPVMPGDKVEITWEDR